MWFEVTWFLCVPVFLFWCVNLYLVDWRWIGHVSLMRVSSSLRYIISRVETTNAIDVIGQQSDFLVSLHWSEHVPICLPVLYQPSIDVASWLLNVFCLTVKYILLWCRIWVGSWIYEIFVQVVLISATLPNEILEMTNKFMTDPVRILVKRDELTLEVKTISVLSKMHSKPFQFLMPVSFSYVSLLTGYKAIFCCRRKRRVEVWHFMWSLWYSNYHSSCYFLQHETKGSGLWGVLILVAFWTINVRFTLNAQIWDHILIYDLEL